MTDLLGDPVREGWTHQQQTFSTAEPSAPPLREVDDTEFASGVGVVEPSASQALQCDFQKEVVMDGRTCVSCNSHHVVENVPGTMADSAHSIQLEDDTDHCPICFESIDAGDAAMRCAGTGGVHHYFHASCLQQWIRSCGEHEATCPICRGNLQIHGQRLNEYLRNDSQGLSDEERSILQRIADGLQGRNGWNDMDSIEKAAHVGGLAAAAGWGFMLGYSGSHEAERATLDILHIARVPRQHLVAQGIGWAAGVLARIIREVVRANSKRDSRDQDDVV
jgi:hypothetical protein